MRQDEKGATRAAPRRITHQRACLTGGAAWAKILGGQLSDEVPLRRIEIVEEPNQIPYKWIAIDKGTRQSLLRLSDLYQLRDVCHRLEWEVVDVKRARGN